MGRSARPRLFVGSPGSRACVAQPRPVDPVAAAALACRLFARKYAALALAWTPAVAASRAFARVPRTAGFTALALLVVLLVAAVDALVLGPLLARALAALGDAGASLATALAGWPLGPLAPLLPAAYWKLAREA